MFATLETFEATGGFSEQVSAGEEILFSLRMQRWGRRHGQRFRVLRGFWYRRPGAESNGGR